MVILGESNRQWAYQHFCLKLLKKSEPAVFAPLSRARYGGYQDGVYRALFAPGDEIFRDMLAAPERTAKIENALRQCGGGDARFQSVSQAPPEDPDAGKREEKNLNGLINMFGRSNVQIDE